MVDSIARRMGAMQALIRHRTTPRTMLSPRRRGRRSNPASGRLLRRCVVRLSARKTRRRLVGVPVSGVRTTMRRRRVSWLRRHRGTLLAVGPNPSRRNRRSRSRSRRARLMTRGPQDLGTTRRIAQTPRDQLCPRSLRRTMKGPAQSRTRATSRVSVGDPLPLPLPFRRRLLRRRCLPSRRCVPPSTRAPPLLQPPRPPGRQWHLGTV